MKFAVIDIGSNTAKAEIYRYKNKKLILLEKYVERDMIADHKDLGTLDDDGVSILINIMNKFRRICERSGVRMIFPYATQSLRGIDNADDVRGRIKDATGLRVTIISGEDEARLCCEAFLSLSGENDGYLTDMGGGSTEINLIDNGKILRSVSLPFGSRSICREFGVDIVPDPEQERLICEAVDRRIEAAGFTQSGKDMFACGGTVSGMFKLYRAITGNNVECAEVKELSDFYATLKNDRDSAEETARIHTPDRYDTIYAGMLAHLRLCTALGCKVIHHAKTTCRRGYAQQLINNGIIK